MPHEFEIREELTLDATPEQVWEAIATGPGVDSWFMGHNEFEAREGGRARISTDFWSAESTITAWEPGRHFAYRSDDDPDGTFMAFEYLIEGRDGGSTVLRFVHSGLLGDDWEEQYDALREGDRLYLEVLARYVKHFPGRFATHNMMLMGPQVGDRDRMWAAYTAAFGVPATAAPGDAVRLGVEGLEPAEGVVEFTVAGTLGVRTTDGLYMLMRGMGDTVVVEYHGFSEDADAKQVERAWRDWIDRTFA